MKLAFHLGAASVCILMTLNPLKAQDKKDPMLALKVPQCKAVKIDGKVEAKEWSGAIKNTQKSGTLRFSHDDKFLNVALELPAAQVTSLFLKVEDRVFVLHASARLGTAVYSKTKSAYTLKSGFAYKKSSPEFEKRDGWLASDRGWQDNKTLEFRIALKTLKWNPKKPEVIYFAAATMSFRGGGGFSFPAGIKDGCKNQRLLMGESPKPVAFDPKTWAQLTLTQKAAAKVSKPKTKTKPKPKPKPGPVK